MSTQRKTDYVDEVLTEEAVENFLKAHPDFFDRHQKLLGAMDLPHATGAAVSLVERQVSVLRQKELRLERQLKELIQVARNNDALAAKIHELSLRLMSATDLASTISAIEEAVRAGFSADHAVLVLFGDPDGLAAVDEGRFFRAAERRDPGLKPFKTFLGSSSPRCGQARDSQLEYLFHDDAAEIGSIALIPLGPKSEFGFLAIGSTDPDRFHPGMSIDFLAHVGDLVAAAIRRY